MRIRPDPANGASYDATGIDDEQPAVEYREPYWHTDFSASYDGDLYRDPAANFHAYANVPTVKLGLNPTAYVGKCHTYLDGSRSY